MTANNSFSRWCVLASIAALLVLGGWGLALGHDDERSEAQEAAAIAAAKIRLGDAIRAAETQTGGTAVEAKYEDEDGRLQVEVTVLGKDGKTQVAKIDAATGDLVTTEPDHDADSKGEDHEHSHHGKDCER